MGLANYTETCIIHSMMNTKPTYNELLDVIRYLSYKSDYESLPITTECREIIEFALENYNKNDS